MKIDFRACGYFHLRKLKLNTKDSLLYEDFRIAAVIIFPLILPFIFIYSLCLIQFSSITQEVIVNQSISTQTQYTTQNRCSTVRYEAKSCLLTHVVASDPASLVIFL